ncbi:YeeE/YedE family protein [Achromobacter sp. GG226]|uniref:YeeE/YedE family protein n=1 Tax=Verticiella alkaliphila TaxID=2779529 RepID=UPI001C0E2E3F|nr:YeeE/YedE family protein [Verticiella sp. GG226]MBU4611760.1 YeeE/YedE family protein [Verticiella sp. GG226]
MTIDWLSFTPGSALAGGALIGLAAALFVLFTGRIAGISGILGGLLRRPATGAGWRLVFFGGLVLAPVVYGLVTDLPQFQIDAGWAALVAAGLLVGVGTRYGAGCTSGHGVCGISRLSLRSLVATAVFMGAGIVTVYVVRHLLT